MKLTAREREVLACIAGWHTHAETAGLLFISAETVRTHIRHAREKLGVTTTREAVRTARKLGLI